MRARSIQRLIVVLSLVPFGARAQSVEDMAREIAKSSHKHEESWAQPNAEPGSVLDAARAIAAQKSVLTPAQPNGENAAQDMAREIAAGSKKHQMAAFDGLGAGPVSNKSVMPPDRFVIFLSSSESDGELQSIMANVAGRRDCTIVFRGPLSGETIPDAFKRIARMVPTNPTVNAIIDPTEFSKNKVVVAPSVAFESAGQTVAMLEGTGNPDLLEERIKAGKKGALGSIGVGHEIIEPDLIETMKSRVAALDFDAMKKGALSRAFDRLQFLDLAVVTKFKQRRFDPSFRAAKDMKLPNGNVLWTAGKVINPLDMHPFGRRIIAFDGTDPKQVAVAIRMKDEVAGKMPVVLVSTAFERGNGWEGINKLQRVIGAPVYLLQDSMRQRFHIEAVPSMVEADGREFVVTEIVPERIK